MFALSNIMPEPSYDIVTVGGATEDIVFYTDQGLIIDNHQDLLRQHLLAFEYGAKINIDHSFAFFGGGAANAAVCFSRLGLKSAAVISIGKDERGRRVISNLEQEGVDMRGISYSRLETGFSFIMANHKGDRIIFSNRAANNDLSLSITAKEIISEGAWTYVASLSGKWRQTLNAVFASSSKVAWNPGHFQLQAGIKGLSSYLKKTEVLLLNKDEALELVFSDTDNKSLPANKLNQAGVLLKIIKSFGPKLIVVTDGRRGATAYDGKKFYRHNISKVKTVDATGVGDAFNASLIAGLHLYNDVDKAMKLAMRNAAAKVQKMGAQTGLMKSKKRETKNKK